MKPSYLFSTFFLLLSTISLQAKNRNNLIRSATVKNEIKHAKGFEHYKGYSILKVTSPWPNATTSFYVLKKKCSYS
jgi:iron complex transport system substrate-binding protein